MPGDLAQYAEHFQVGGRVRGGVGVPLADGVAFQEWGVVSSPDRDRLIGYISARHFSRLSHHGRGGEGPARRGEAKRGRRPLLLALGIVAVSAFVGSQLHAVVAKRERGGKHEIERVFEEGIAAYLRQRR